MLWPSPPETLLPPRPLKPHQRRSASITPQQETEVADLRLTTMVPSHHYFQRSPSAGGISMARTGHWVPRPKFRSDTWAHTSGAQTHRLPLSRQRVGSARWKDIRTPFLLKRNAEEREDIPHDLRLDGSRHCEDFLEVLVHSSQRRPYLISA